MNIVPPVADREADVTGLDQIVERNDHVVRVAEQRNVVSIDDRTFQGDLQRLQVGVAKCPGYAVATSPERVRNDLARYEVHVDLVVLVRKNPIFEVELQKGFRFDFRWQLLVLTLRSTSGQNRRFPDSRARSTEKRQCS